MQPSYPVIRNLGLNGCSPARLKSKETVQDFVLAVCRQFDLTRKEDLSLDLGMCFLNAYQVTEQAQIMLHGNWESNSVSLVILDRLGLDEEIIYKLMSDYFLESSDNADEQGDTEAFPVCTQDAQNG